MAGMILEKAAIPYDGGDGAALALETITPLLGTVGGSVHFVMVLDQLVQNQLTEFASVEGLSIEQAAIVACERLVASAEASAVVASFVVVSEDDVVAGVVNAAKEAGCSAIVLPTHGFKAVTRWLMGNLRDKIVQASSLPVLVLPPAS